MSEVTIPIVGDKVIVLGGELGGSHAKKVVRVEKDHCFVDGHPEMKLDFFRVAVLKRDKQKEAPKDIQARPRLMRRRSE